MTLENKCILAVHRHLVKHCVRQRDRRGECIECPDQGPDHRAEYVFDEDVSREYLVGMSHHDGEYWFWCASFGIGHGRIVPKWATWEDATEHAGIMIRFEGTHGDELITVAHQVQEYIESCR